MTVVIGIRCTNGIVLGADSAATFMSQGQATAQQRSMRKLTTKGTLMTGFAGSQGVAQRLCGQIEMVLHNPPTDTRTHEIVQQLRRTLWSTVLQLEMTAVRDTREALRIPGCEASSQCEMLVATVLNERHELIHINEHGGTALVEDDVPYVAIGIGQSIAYPFLGFTRRMFWQSELPSIATATFSIMWTLMHVVDSNAAGMSRPFSLAMLEPQSGQWTAREVAHAELKEHEDRVVEAEQLLRDWGVGMTESKPERTLPPE